MNILEEALSLTRGDRNESYGSPLENMTVTAELINSYLYARGFRKFLDAEDIPMIMVLVKVARQGHCRKRDTLVDIAGYADVADRVVSEQEEREAASLVEKGLKTA